MERATFEPVYSFMCIVFTFPKSSAPKCGDQRCICWSSERLGVENRTYLPSRGALIPKIETGCAFTRAVRSWVSAYSQEKMFNNLNLHKIGGAVLCSAIYVAPGNHQGS